MKIYLAGERTATATATAIERQIGDAASIWTEGVKRRLFSFYYHGFSAGGKFEKGTRGISAAIEDGFNRGWDLFLDSGAFTGWSQKKEISVSEYARYVKWSKRIWTVCSSLDFIGRGEEAARKSYTYFRQLKEAGAEVAPVFHVREPDHWLQRYIDEGHDYILLGGMVAESGRWLEPRLDGLWNTILTASDGAAKVKVHGFGLTNFRLMFKYPFWSVDSSSWLQTGIFGACIFRTEQNTLRKVVFSEESPEARKYRGWHYANLPREAKDVVHKWLEPYKVTPEQLSSHYSYRDVINAAVFQSLEDLGTDRFVLQQPTLFGGLDSDELDEDEAAE